MVRRIVVSDNTGAHSSPVLASGLVEVLEYLEGKSPDLAFECWEQTLKPLEGIKRRTKVCALLFRQLRGPPRIKTLTPLSSPPPTSNHGCTQVPDDLNLRFYAMCDRDDRMPVLKAAVALYGVPDSGVSTLI